MTFEAFAASREMWDRLCAEYPHVPRTITEYMYDTVQREPACRLIAALHEHPRKTLRALDCLFEEVAAILGATEDELLGMADWHSRDKEPTRFDAMLAEFRAVRFLHEEGFHEIELLASRGAERADGTAGRGQGRYAFEVVCPSREHYRWPAHLVRGRDLEDYVVERFRTKKSQLERTAQEHNCQSLILIVVVVEENLNALMEQAGFVSDVLEPAWRDLGEPPGTHVVIVGKWKADQAVFPAWPVH